MNHVSRALIVTLILAVATPLASAQTSPQATQQDLADMEGRLINRMEDKNTEMRDWVEYHHSQTANVIRNRLNDLEAQVNVINDTILPAIQAMANQTGDNTEAIDALIEQAALTGALVAEMRAELADALSTMEVLRNETFEDHVNLYKGLIDANGNLVLPALAGQLEDTAEQQQALTMSQYRIRADLDNMTAMMTSGFNTMNEGQEATFIAADSSAGRITFTNVVMILLFITNLVLLSYALKIPKKLWDRIQYEGRRVESRGEYVEPNCPAPDDDNLEFGDYHGCEYAESEACPVADECKTKAVEQTQEAVVRGETPVQASETKEPVVDVAEEVRPKAKVMDLNAFGGA